ncbi:MAG: diacylglycerol kinase family lipid kinase [Alistipes sp.]|nr:diacylglycerol kinase family lipid kinase [Alistipes sp.]
MSKQQILDRPTIEGSVKWFVIVNPIAGSGKGLDDYPLISKLLRDNNIHCEAVFTEHKYHATELTVSAIEAGYRHIIVVGGDGTLHEVINGVFIQKYAPTTEITIAVIAIGTGNDWIRMYGIPTRYSEAIRAIREGYTFLQDVAEVEYEESMYRQKRHMANVAGLGFDAAVIKSLQHATMKGKFGRSIYLWCVLRSFFKHKSTGVKIWVDDKLIFNNLIFSIAIGVCKYNGGGMQQLPSAIADDGLLDVTLIKPLHWWHVLFRLHRLYNGTIYSIGHVLHAQGSKIRIESSPEIHLEVDGEALGVTPVEFRVLHRDVRVVVNRSFLKKLRKKAE